MRRFPEKNQSNAGLLYRRNKYWNLPINEDVENRDGFVRFYGIVLGEITKNFDKEIARKGTRLLKLSKK